MRAPVTTSLPRNDLSLPSINLNPDYSRNTQCSAPALSVDGQKSRPMGKLFQFDDEVPMRFFILSESFTNLTEAIEQLGGEISSPFHAHFSLVDEKELTREMGQLPAQLVNGGWAQQSITAGRIQPIYTYLRDANTGFHEDGLAGLRESARDFAELVKTLMDFNGVVPDPEMYKLLHRKFPHQTSQQWQSLYEGSKPKIEMAIMAVKVDLERTLDDCVMFLLCGRMEEGEEGTLMMDEEDTLLAREDDMEIEEGDKVPRENMITNGDTTDNHDLTSLSGSSTDADADVDPDFSGSDIIVKPKRKGGPHNKYTEAELNAMAGFLVEQGLIHASVGPNRWKLFSQQNPSMNNRTPEALCAHYGRNKNDINARAIALSNLRQGQPPAREEKAVTLSGDDDTNTAQRHHDEEQPLPPGWEKFHSERYKGTPFYHHAESATSFWKLSDVLKFSESRGDTMHSGRVSSEKQVLVTS